MIRILIPDKSQSGGSLQSKRELLEENRLLKRKLAEAERESASRDKREQILSKAIKLGYWQWDQVANKPIQFSEQFADIHGFSLEQLYDLYKSEADLFSFIHPDDLEYYKRQITHEARSENLRGRAYTFDYRIIKPSGEVRHVREMEYGFLEEEGKPTRLFGAVQDITDHKEALELRKQSEERYSSLFCQLPLGVEERDYSSIKKALDNILSTGVDNIREYLESNGGLLREMVANIHITAANDALLNLYGVSSLEEYCAGEADIDSWWSDDWVNYFASEFEELLDPGNSYLAELTETRVDGSSFETRMISRVVQGYEDSWERVITLHDDITERKQIELALLDAKTEAEAANQAKSRFMSNMSHELRTPLNAILGFSQLFDYDRNLDPKHRHNARQINQAGLHLLSLVEEILDLSRIEAGDLDLSIEPVSLSGTLADSVAWVHELARSQSVSIEFDQAQFRGLFVQADVLRLKQVFLNLLSNAVKYNNHQGNVGVSWSKPQENRVRVEINDTGEGLSEEQLSGLFQPFDRLGAESRDIEGTGIGLVITRHLVKMMQGRIGFDSVPGEGSNFWVELPLASETDKQYPPESDRPASPEVAANKPRRNGLQILVAEDNLVNQELIAAQMRELGFTADFAENGADALKLWQSGQYNFLMTDIRMPIMNGYELIRHIRSMEPEGGPAAPIVAVTANAMEADIKKCFKAGANDVMTKPFPLKELKNTLEKWWN